MPNSDLSPFNETKTQQGRDKVESTYDECRNCRWQLQHDGLNTQSFDVGPCQKIVACQGASSSQQFQSPEPWTGWMELAPILFLSSNPSVSETEQYPDATWQADQIVDFFEMRLSGKWTRAGRYTLQKDGVYSKHWVRFWAAAGQRARELLQREIVPGIDFAMTEVVHCKSRSEEGVDEASEFCVRRYLPRILEVSTAKVIVIYVERARHPLRPLEARSLEPF